jgi:hypothetical protein
MRINILIKHEAALEQPIYRHMIVRSDSTPDTRLLEHSGARKQPERVEGCVRWSIQVMLCAVFDLEAEVTKRRGACMFTLLMST